nr:nitroreductase family protein [Tissierella carlieri]
MYKEGEIGVDYNNFYDIIFKRKSIRKYDLSSLDNNILQELLDYIGNLKPMYKNIEVQMKIVTGEVVRNLFPIKAPYYLLVYSEEKEKHITNAGFMLQQVDLFLSANGIGSCWAGLTQPKKEIANESKLNYIIALAFGKPAENIHRDNLSEFKRKAIAEIRNNGEKDELLEAVRLAPSAVNSQPWYFKVDKNKIHAYCVKSNLIKGIIYNRLNQIDMGIGICHLCIAAKHLGEDYIFISDKDALDNPPKGYYYITSIEILEKRI